MRGVRRVPSGVVLAALLVCVSAGPSLAEPRDERLCLIASPREGAPPPPARPRVPGTRQEGGTSLGRLMVKVTIRTYQVLLSSQDRPSCQFTPSCSNYCLQAVSNHGLVRGVLMCSDRVMRCHPGAAGHYQRDSASGRALDLAVGPDRTVGAPR
jgi:putative membrane protein insertion efficiency factor